jgi:hypothetical protein
VSLELLRTQQRVHQVDHHQDGHKQHDYSFKIHKKPSLELVAGHGITDRNREEQQRENHHQQIKHGCTSFPFWAALAARIPCRYGVPS